MAYQIERLSDNYFLVRFTYRRKPKAMPFATEAEAAAFIRSLEKRDRAVANRRNMTDAYRSVGMARVRGNLGGTYYE